MLTMTIALAALILALYAALLPPPTADAAPNGLAPRPQRPTRAPVLTTLAALTVAHSPARLGRVTPTYLALRRAFAAEARASALGVG